MHPREQKVVKWLLGVLVSGFACFMLAFVLYFKVLSPEAKEARRFLKLMPVDQIQAVDLEPLPHNPNPLFHGFISITNRAQISKIADLIHSARRHSPSHPQQRWSVVLRFVTKDRQFSGEVSSTSNQGVLFYYGLDVGGGTHFGTYRQDALGPLLEALAKTEDTHLSVRCTPALRNLDAAIAQWGTNTTPPASRPSPE